MVTPADCRDLSATERCGIASLYAAAGVAIPEHLALTEQQQRVIAVRVSGGRGEPRTMKRQENTMDPKYDLNNDPFADEPDNDDAEQRQLRRDNEPGGWDELERDFPYGPEV